MLLEFLPSLFGTKYICSLSSVEINPQSPAFSTRWMLSDAEFICRYFWYSFFHWNLLVFTSKYMDIVCMQSWLFWFSNSAEVTFSIFVFWVLFLVKKLTESWILTCSVFVYWRKTASNSDILSVTSDFLREHIYWMRAWKQFGMMCLCLVLGGMWINICLQ